MVGPHTPLGQRGKHGRTIRGVGRSGGEYHLQESAVGVHACAHGGTGQPQIFCGTRLETESEAMGSDMAALRCIVFRVHSGLAEGGFDRQVPVRLFGSPCLYISLCCVRLGGGLEPPRVHRVGHFDVSVFFLPGKGTICSTSGSPPLPL